MAIDRRAIERLATTRVDAELTGGGAGPPAVGPAEDNPDGDGAVVSVGGVARPAAPVTLISSF